MQPRLPLTPRDYLAHAFHTLSTLFRLPPTSHRRQRRARMRLLLLLILLLIIILFIPLSWLYRPPPFLISYFARKWPDVLFQVSLPDNPNLSPPGPAKTVALTIDDAPSRHTLGILQTLKEYNAHATFFVIGGQIRGREKEAAMLVAGGMELGNHAMHDEASMSLDDEELEKEIGEVREKIKVAYREGNRMRFPDLAGGEDARSAASEGGETDGEELEGMQLTPPLYFRPGSGFFSTRMRELVSRLGYRIVLGGVYPHDAQISWPWLNAKHVLSLVRPGAIIVCHDRRGWTIPMLRTVLPELRARGYKVVTVTELLKAGKDLEGVSI